MTFTPDYTLNTWNLPFRNNGLVQPATSINTGWSNQSGFGSWNTWSNNGIFSVPSSSSSSSSSSSAQTGSGIRLGESYEDYQIRREKERKAYAENLEFTNSLIETQNKDRKESNKIMQELEANKEADGSSVKKAKLTEMTGMQIAGVVLQGAANGICDTVAGAAKTIAGFDKKGKWSWKRCLGYVALTVGTILACTPAAAAAIPCLAYAGTALAVAGVATGAVMAGKGVYNTVKAVKHDDADELKKGVGQITGGAMIAISAGRGLRAQAGKAGVSVFRPGSMPGQKGRIRISGSMERFAKNVVNAWDASKTTANRMRELRGIYSATNPVTGGFFHRTGIRLSNYSNTLSTYRAEVNIGKVAEVTSTYETNFRTANRQLTEAINNTKDSALKQVLKKELLNLRKANCIDDTLDSWEAVGSSLKTGSKGLGWRSRIPGNDANAVRKSLKAIEQSLQAAKKSKFDVINQMSKTKNYATQVKDFGFSTSFRGIGNYFTTAAASFQGKTPMQKGWGVVTLGLSAMGPEYTAAAMLKSHPNSWIAPVAGIAAMENPKKEGMGDMLTMIAPGCKTSEAYSKDAVEEQRQTLKSIDDYLAELYKLRNKLKSGSEQDAKKASERVDELKKQIAQAQAQAEAQAQAMQAEQAKEAKA